jgi:hypothetical protein
MNKFDKFVLSTDYMPGIEDRRKVPTIFLSPNKDFTIKFIDYKPDADEDRPLIYLYTVQLTRELNLFNEAANYDLNLFKTKHPVIYKQWRAEKKGGDYRPGGSGKGAARHFAVVEQYAYIFKKLGYDGYNTLGMYSTFNPLNTENIALFDASAIKILKREEVNRFKWVHHHEQLAYDLRQLIRKYHKDDLAFYQSRLKMLGYTDDEIRKDGDSTSYQIQCNRIKSVEEYKWDLENVYDNEEEKDVRDRLKSVFNYTPQEIDEFIGSLGKK